MPGTKISISSLFLSVALAQPPVIPLDLGNSWVYGGRAGAYTVEVTEVKEIGGERWSRLTGWPSGPVWLRQTDKGTVMARDAESEAPRVWVDLGAQPGEAFRAGVDECAGEGRIAKRPTAWSGAIGSFEDVVKVDYTSGRCADTGVASDVFLSWVGLVERSVQTIAGPVASQLLYAKLGESTVILAQDAGFGVSVRGEGTAPLVLLHLRNGRNEPLEITFPSGQQFDVAMKDENGKTVYVWSADKLFPAVVTRVRLERGEKTWAVPLTLPALPGGKYVVEAWLATNPVVYKGSVPLLIP